MAKKKTLQSGNAKSFPVHHFLLSLLLFHSRGRGEAGGGQRLVHALLVSNPRDAQSLLNELLLYGQLVIGKASDNIKRPNSTPLAIALMNENWLRLSSSVVHLPGYLPSTQQALLSPV